MKKKTKKTKKTKRGFTLIELLVVIAVIGILAGIVLVSVRKAPDAAKDARIQAALTQVRDVAQMNYVNSNNSFTNICASNKLNTVDVKDFLPLHTDIVGNNGGHDEACVSTADSYCVKAQLKVDALKSFCVDSTGATLVATTTLASFCDASTTIGITCALD